MYIRQVFCAHDFEYDEAHMRKEGILQTHREGTRVYMRCNKCAYTNTHWKYLD
jgi:hypothetical protein